MTVWLYAKCSNCGPFWGQETTIRKIKSCSRCNGPLSAPPENLIYSTEDLEEEEDLSDEFKDFENYCRCQLTSSGDWGKGHWVPGEHRKPVREEIADRGEYAVLEVDTYHRHIKKITDYYCRQANIWPINKKINNEHSNAWLNFWNREYKKSQERVREIRIHFEGAYKEYNESWYGDDMIRCSMDDLWTSEWFHNKNEKLTEKKSCHLKMISVSRFPGLYSQQEAEEIGLERWLHPYISPDDEIQSWSTEELSQNIMGCISSIDDYRKDLQKNVDNYQLKAPAPVNSRTKIIWRKSGKLMHLTLAHPLKDGTEQIETIGTDPDKIYDAKKRIEAARWLAQSKEDLKSHTKREKRLLNHLDRIADILDELNYHDKFLNVPSSNSRSTIRKAS